jgi:hypothetical protein
MNNNTWKILAFILLGICIVGFFWGYTKYKDAETINTIRIKELEMKRQQDSIKIEENKGNSQSIAPFTFDIITTLQ